MAMTTMSGDCQTTGGASLTKEQSDWPGDKRGSVPSTTAVEHHFADLTGVRLHYAAAGSGDLIVFLHGFPQCWYAWRHQLAEFGRDHLAVAPDMRGYNLSDKPARIADYDIHALVADVRELAEHLGQRRFVLVGHDWGGIVALAFAL